MAKTVKRKKINTCPPKLTIQELHASRDGGQIALVGFTYQFLYSCYLILSESDNDTTFHLEGIEDIDHYKCEVTGATITHIQVKYSTQKQDASFLKDVLKNYIEAYLLDKTRNFKLIYDFQVAKGNMSKLFNNSLDQTSTIHWKNIVKDLENENPLWNWFDFSFDDFIDKLTFEKKEKYTLSEEIEKKLIEIYDISTDNITLYANGIKMCCLKKMECRGSINKQELDVVIQNIKDDISKGTQNPAHGWIKNLNFDVSNSDTDLTYFEGKKVTLKDIALQLPVRRFELEKEIEKSIQENRVTVIKASSGQGKTTLALQVAYSLQCEYKIYQLLWCNDSRELYSIVQYFKSRVKLGEKPLIIIDNLDSQLGEWNRLAQLLQEEVSYHYKLLLTTREDDWYNYSGDLSNVKALQIVKLFLEEQEAKSIFAVLQKAKKLHQSITDWRGSWEKVAEKKLLIEYVYLLTHGEILADRIAHQILQLNKSDTGKIKCEILRKVCFADICGIKLSTKKLIANLIEKTGSDYGLLLKSIENEFLIHVDSNEKYVEGLHPVRSQHVVDILHEFIEINDTAVQVVQLTESAYLSKLFSYLPRIISDCKEKFYSEIAESLWSNDNYERYVLSLRGLLSGSVIQYFKKNQDIFNDANNHGGLFLLSNELSPFINFEEFGYSLNTLNELRKIIPDNTNIQYLCNLKDSASNVTLSDTEIFYFSKAIFSIFQRQTNISDIPSLATIAYWLLNIDRNLNLSSQISLTDVWDAKENYSIEVISNVMYTCFYGKKKIYIAFVEDNLHMIVQHLKRSTHSLKLYLDNDAREIHVEYILLPSEINGGNEESVSRLKTICKTLPIFETYCADAIKPTFDLLSGYKVHDDAHKAMPIRNIVIMFHEDFTSIWNKTIMSNYECDSIFDWLSHWMNIRRNTVMFFENCSIALCKLLEGKPIGSLATIIDDLRKYINKDLIKEYRYPKEDRPFEEKAVIPEGLSGIKSDYFMSISNFSNQLAGFIQRDNEQNRLAIINLTKAHNSLDNMQKYFGNLSHEQQLLVKEHEELCGLEECKIQELLITCKYFQVHEPSRYFHKLIIKSWYSNNNSQLMGDIRAALNSLAEEFSIYYPERDYYIGILKYYPIITSDLDVMNPEVLIKFLYLCIPITAFDINYLVIACSNKQNQVMHGLKVPMKFLDDLKIAFEAEDEEMMQSISPPFPEEINKQFLDCFTKKYDLFVRTPSEYEGIDSIIELLWKYSRSSKELSSEPDVDYLASIKKCLEEEIIKKLTPYKSKIPDDEYHELTQICDATFNGSPFENVQLNDLHNNFFLRAQSRNVT